MGTRTVGDLMETFDSNEASNAACTEYFPDVGGALRQTKYIGVFVHHAVDYVDLLQGLTQAF
ncbi:hypothetical protein ATERTT37_005818 [Aspergillus terreus]